MRLPTGATHARAEGAADVLEHWERLARRMQGLALMPDQAFRSPDRIHDLGLVVLGDRRKAHDLPMFLGRHVADEIVPRVTPKKGRLSCKRCMISTMAPCCLSFSRL
jgi:hypothetical protein